MNKIRKTWVSKEVRRLVRETEKAWLIQLETGHTHWFPKSQCILDMSEKILFIKENFLPKLSTFLPSPEDIKDQLKLF